MAGYISSSVSKGQVSTGIVLYDNVALFVEPGAVANYTTVNTTSTNGGLLISSGGTANYTTLNHGDIYIMHGGTANYTTVNGTMDGNEYYGMLVERGGTANYTTVNSGGVVGVSGTVNSTTHYGGWFNIYSGGTAVNTLIDGGQPVVSAGGIVSATTGIRGMIHVFGSADKSIIGEGAETKKVFNFHLYSGAIANNTTVNSGGTLWVLGGVMNDTVINGGVVSVGGSGYNNGVMNRVTLSSGGNLLLYGGTVNNLSYQGGYLKIFSGTATINPGAYFSSSSSTSLYNVIGLTSLGSGAVFIGNTARYGGGAIYTYGQLTIGSGAAFQSNVALSSGGGAIHNDGYGRVTIGSGVLFAENIASGTGSGGALYNGSHGVVTISSGAVFRGNVAERGGAIFNNSSGTITLGDAKFETYTDTIYNYGTIILNGKVSFGGNVTLADYTSDGTVLTGTLENNGTIDFNLSVREETDGLLLNDWSNVSGMGDYTITIGERQSGGEYQLIGNAIGFDKTITVYSETGSNLGRVSLDMTEDLDYRGIKLKLKLDEATNTVLLMVDSKYSSGTDRERVKTTVKIPKPTLAGLDNPTYSLTQAPDWLSIDPATGEFSGTTGKIMDTETGYGTTEVVVTATSGETTREHIVELVVVPENIEGDGHGGGGGDSWNMTDLVAETVKKRKEHGTITYSFDSVSWEYEGLNVSVTDLSASLMISDIDYEIKLHGKLELDVFTRPRGGSSPFLPVVWGEQNSASNPGLTFDLSGENGDKYIRITTPHDFASMDIGVVGTLEFRNLNLGFGFFLERGTFSVDTETKTWSGESDLQVNWFDKTISTTYEVVGTKVNRLGLGVDGLNIAVGTTGFLLTGIRGEVDHITDGEKLEFGGTLKFRYGMEIAGFSVANLTLTGKLNSEQISGTAELELLNSLVTGTASITINWKEQFLNGSGSLTLLGLGTISAGFKIDGSGNVMVRGSLAEGIGIGLNVSDHMSVDLNSMRFGHGYDVMLQFSNDGNLANDYYAAWYTFTCFGASHVAGIKYSFNGTWSYLNASSVEPLLQNRSVTEPAALRSVPESVTNESDLSDGDSGPAESGPVVLRGDPEPAQETVTETAGWLFSDIHEVVLLSASWESGTAEVTLKDSDGTVLTLKELESRADIEVVESLSSENGVVIAVNAPADGTWGLTVSGTASEIRFSASTLGNVDEFSAPELNAELDGRTVTLTWNCSELPANAELSLYYDTDEGDYDGLLLATLKPTGTSGTYEWVVPDAIGGDLRFYAVLTAPETIPAISDCTEAVTVEEVEIEVELNDPGWTYIGSGFCATDAVLSSTAFLEVNGGVLYGTTKAAGTLDMYNGARLAGTLILTGLLQTGGKNSLTVEDGSVIQFDLSNRTTSQDIMICCLSDIVGVPTYQIAVADGQTYGTYKLASGATDFDGSISILDTSGKQLGILTLDESLTVGHDLFVLNLDNDFLTISISLAPDVTPPTISNIRANETETTYFPVVVTVDFADDYELASTLYRFGENGEWTDYVDGVTVSENATVFFKAIDTSGNESELAQYNVSNIMPPPDNAISDMVVPLYESLTVLSDELFYNTVVDGGIFYVSSGGTALKTTVNANGRMSVFSGGTACGVSVLPKGDLNVSSGGVAMLVDWTPCEGTLSVDAGGYLSFVSRYSGVYCGADYQLLFKTPTLDSTTIDISYKDYYVMSDGIAESAVMQGRMHVFSGGTANSITVSRYSELFISSGGLACNTVVDEVGHIDVRSGGTANNTEINSRATLNVSLGGSADTVNVNKGMLCVYSGGTATNVLWTPCEGSVAIADGGYVAFVSQYSGVYYGSGNHLLSNNTIMESVILSGNNETTMQVLSGGTAINTTVDRLAKLTVSSGGSILNTGLVSNGQISVSRGGTADGTTISDGRMYVSRGGTANDTTINSGGDFNILSDGTANSATINSCGIMNVFSGGVVNSATVNAGGYLFVSSGGAATEVLENGGYVYVMDGADVAFVPNTFSDIVLSKTSATVHSSTVANCITLDSGGKLHVSGGGIADNTTVSSGGSLLILSGGTANSATVNSKGTLRCSSGGRMTGQMTFLTGAVVSGGSGAVLDFDISGLSSDAAARVNNLALTRGVFSYTLTVSASQTEGIYTLAEGAAGFGKEISVLNTSGRALGTLTVGQTLTIKDKDYTLNEANGALTVSLRKADVIPDTAAPTVSNVKADIETPTNRDVTVTADFADDVKLTASLYRIGEDGEWRDYPDGGVTVKNNTTIYFKAIDAWDNESALVSFTVANIDRDHPVIMLAGDNETPLQASTLSARSEDGIDIFYSMDDGATWTKYDGPISVTSNGKYVFRATDAAGNVGTAEYSFTNIQPSQPTPTSDVAPQTRSWDKVEEAAQYVVEYAMDDAFENVIRLVVDSNSLDSFQMPSGSYQMRVKPIGGDEWTVAEPVVAEETSGEPKLIKSNADGNADMFFVNKAGTWESGYVAQHAGSTDDKTWDGTGEFAALLGRNKLTDIIEGSTDANILLMTDDSDGDALFVDDIYSDSPGELGLSQSRIAQIDEIRAGAGDDIVDMTSQRFEYTGDGLTIRGGDGNDVVWANKGNNRLFGDAGNDRLVGASGNDVIVGGIGNDRMHGGGGNDVFAFCDNWGTDTVEQLETGTVTLWFAGGDESKWNSDTLTYTDGDNSVRVSGVTLDRITLKFGGVGDDAAQFDTLSGMGAFADFTSKQIFEESGKGILASQ